MDRDKAYVLGLLHDIGRRVGVVGERHLIEGYRFCMAKGWNDVAKICITHSYVIQDVETAIGAWDVPETDYVFAKEFIRRAEYDDYDRLVQLCDSLATADGFCLLEKRFVDVARRYGVNEHVVARWNATFDIKEDFEKRMGCSIYDTLDGVRDSTFLS